MNRYGIPTLLTIVVLALVAVPTVHAQYDYNWAGASVSCDAGIAEVHGSVTNFIGFAEDWTGWVVGRTTVGTCSGWEAVSPVQAFPDSGLTAIVDVTEAIDGDQSLKYAFLLVTDGGDLIAPPGSYFGEPNIYFDYVTCGAAPITRGSLEDNGWAFVVNACSGSCWAPVGYIDPWNLPEQYHGYADTGQLLDLYGSLYCGGFEGCGLTVTLALPVPDCSNPVATREVTWSSLKSMFEHPTR